MAEYLERQPKTPEGHVYFPESLGATPDVLRWLIFWAYNGILYSPEDGKTIKTPDSITLVQLYVLAANIGNCTLQNHIVDFLDFEFKQYGKVITGLVPTIWQLTTETSSKGHCALRNLIWDQCVLLNALIQYQRTAGYPAEFFGALMQKIFL